MSLSKILQRLVYPPSGVGGHTARKVDSVGADLKTSLGRINEEKARCRIDGACFLVKAREGGWEAGLSVFLFV